MPHTLASSRHHETSSTDLIWKNVVTLAGLVCVRSQASPTHPANTAKIAIAARPVILAYPASLANLVNFSSHFNSPVGHHPKTNRLLFPGSFSRLQRPIAIVWLQLLFRAAGSRAPCSCTSRSAKHPASNRQKVAAGLVLGPFSRPLFVENLV